MPITLSLRRSARINSRGRATSDRGVTRSWSALESRVACLAGGLQGLGLSPGGRVAILAFNSAAYLEALYAIPWAGGIVVPLNTRLAGPELSYQLADSEAAFLLFDSAHETAARQLAGELPHLRLIRLDGDAAGGDSADWNDLASRSPAAPDAALNDSDLAGIFYTGGTTGRAKGVTLTHGNVLHNVANLMPHFRFGPETRGLHAAPMFHIADSLGIYGVTMAGGQHFFVPKFDAAQVLAAIETEAVSFVILVPTMVKMLLDAPDFAPGRLRSLTDLFYGGSVMPAPVLNRALNLLPHLRFHQGYGLTETAPTATYLSPEQHRAALAGRIRSGSAGQQVYSVDVAIMDGQGRPLPANTTGEICVKGPTVMRGYWRKPEATADAFFGDWFRTGDVGRLDEDGFLTVVDRVKDMIISGGENIYSAEVESVLLEHAAVLECAVIGVPSERWGEAVHAVVRLRPGLAATPAELAEHCRARLAGYKCPRSFSFRDAPLPLSGAGKILKSALRAESVAA